MSPRDCGTDLVHQHLGSTIHCSTYGSESGIEAGTQTRLTSYVVNNGREYGLSNEAQAELLIGAMARGARMRMRVRGVSMIPFIRDGDVLTVESLDAREPRVGDIVPFRHHDTGRMAIHRVVAKAAQGWIMRGDNSEETDGVVSREDMLGRVVRVERGTRDVRMTLGAGGLCIALLNRGTMWARLRTMWALPRRAATSVARRLQGLKVYRAIARASSLRFEVAIASERDLEAVFRRFGADARGQSQSADSDVVNLVARRGGKVIGYAMLARHSEKYAPWDGDWLFGLAVRVRYRGCGVGEALTRRRIEEAKARGVEELLVAVNEGNVPVVGLYEKLGFREAVLPGLEPELAAEAERSGQRRMVMRCRLTSEGDIA